MKKLDITWNDEEIRTSIMIFFIAFLGSVGLIGIACKQIEIIASVAGFDNWIFSLIMGAIKGSQWLWLSFAKH